MSYCSEEEQYQASGPSRPRFTGWLTMAPDIDTTSAAASTFKAASVATHASAPARSAPRSPTCHAPSTHGFAVTAQTVPTASKRQKRFASFHIGSPDSLSASPVGSVGSRASDRSNGTGGSDESDDPLFDVRASFAPMPAYSKARSGPPKLNGGGGMRYGGLEWRGKTVHAVEQEMEQLGDTALLSHAPDAGYLASRLEGLKRNLEVEAFQPRWIGQDYEDAREADGSPVARDCAVSGEGAQPIAILPGALASRRDAQRSPFEADDQAMADALESMPPLSHHPSRPISNASSVSLVDERDIDDLTMDCGFAFTSTAHGDTLDDARPASPITALVPSVPVEIVASDAPTLPVLSAPLDPAAKAAALDARIEVRALRRGDLEQVRELHIFHGDADRSPEQAENYTTSASFLLRLLVDDRHVCLVAVAKPLPEPLDPLPSASDLSRARQSHEAFVSPPAGASLATSFSPSSGPSSLISGASSSVLDSGGQTPTDSLFSAAMHRPGAAPTDVTGATSVTDGDAPAAPNARDKPSAAQLDLPGPTEAFAPPSVVRVMAAPPPKGASIHTDTVVGVISAQLSPVQQPEEASLWLEAGARRGTPAHTAAPRIDVEAHVLTLAVLPAERSQGIGARLLDSLGEACNDRARAVVRRRASPAAPARGDGATTTVRTVLEVHPSNARALALYGARGFVRTGTRRGFYRGDGRVPLGERLKVGGLDAWVLERVGG